MCLRGKTSTCLTIALIAVVVLVFTPTLLAEEQADHSLIQPQRWRNAIWAVGLFVVLLVILGRFAWKPVLRAIQAREQAIADNIADAERRQAESAELLAEYRSQLETAGQEAHKLMAQAAARSEADRNEIIAQANSTAQATLAEVREEIDQAKRESLDEIYRITADLATSVAGQIIRKEISPEDHRRLVEESVSELKKKT
ncbi:MAG: F0F1 ATP synthase subunit B [Planctomycetes bacterium]|nr:F0F1 ATP synthase subunit B [Planctomycetota bacterium]